MQRKLIRQGAGGYTIYLPKRWVDAKGLSGGDVVQLRDESGTITIDTPTRQRKEVSIPLSDESDTDLRNLLTHHYRTGVDTIRITSASVAQQRSIQRTTDDLLLGFEITSRKGDTMLIENVSEPSGERYDTLLRRVFLLIFETDDLVLARAKGTQIEEPVITEHRRQLDEFVLFCRRTIQKDRYARDPLLHWELLTFLMHIEHAYAYLFTRIAERKGKCSSQTVALLQGCKPYFTLLYDAYYQRDAERIRRMNNEKEMQHFTACYRALAKTAGQESIIVAHVRELYRLMQIGSSPVLAMILKGEQAISGTEQSTSLGTSPHSEG